MYTEAGPSDTGSSGQADVDQSMQYGCQDIAKNRDFVQIRVKVNGRMPETSTADSWFSLSARSRAPRNPESTSL
ncbi:unnamed protein product [Fusarium venenatum]|uniref:Uncharacterized protein n=1 Tax=Fusarium venenatum TaxID=56646 RepID=A0A2L2T5T0_9HYPO|nr:uncharacterized protein FVRRES_04857 [Fusarium venenatum]CEI60421.1 unnamed protein product [Fusarium venenatum]